MLGGMLIQQQIYIFKWSKIYFSLWHMPKYINTPSLLFRFISPEHWTAQLKASDIILSGLLATFLGRIDWAHLNGLTSFPRLEFLRTMNKPIEFKVRGTYLLKLFIKYLIKLYLI